MKIAGLSVWNEFVGLPRAIQSVQGWAEEIRVYDGAYREFPHERAVSTDGTRESRLFDQPQIRLIDPPGSGPWVSQIEKRSRMLADCEPGDQFLWLDGDEWLSSVEGLEAFTGDVGWLEVHSTLYSAPYRQPRLYRVQAGWHYAGRHYWIFDRDKLLVSSHAARTTRYQHQDLEGRIYNFRRPDRDRAKSELRKNRVRTEGSFKSEIQVYRKEAASALKPIAMPAFQTGKTFVHAVSDSVDYTMVLPVSRPWAISLWANWFRDVWIPPGTELLGLIDTPRSDVWTVACEQLKKLRSKFEGGIRLFWNQQPTLPETSRVSSRRDRILSHWHLFRTEARGRVILGAEDDSLPDPDLYRKLLSHLHPNGPWHFLQGTIVSRWSRRLIPHWTIRAEVDRIVEIRSGVFDPNKPIQEISGGGWYAFACPTDVVRRADFRWSQSPPIGPDLQFVYSLHQQGYRCGALWDAWVEHHQQTEVLKPDDPAGLVSWTWILDGGNWRTIERPWGRLDRSTGSLKISPSQLPILGTSNGHVEEMIPRPEPTAGMGEVRVRALATFQHQSSFVERGQLFVATAVTARNLAARKLVKILEG